MVEKQLARLGLAAANAEGLEKGAYSGHYFPQRHRGVCTHPKFQIQIKGGKNHKGLKLQ